MKFFNQNCQTSIKPGKRIIIYKHISVARQESGGKHTRLHVYVEENLLILICS